MCELPHVYQVTIPGNASGSAIADIRARIRRARTVAQTKLPAFFNPYGGVHCRHFCVRDLHVLQLQEPLTVTAHLCLVSPAPLTPILARLRLESRHASARKSPWTANAKRTTVTVAVTVDIGKVPHAGPFLLAVVVSFP
nr:hypothetical protein Itr_chr06CG04250 [Ipomoea trifida]